MKCLNQTNNNYIFNKLLLLSVAISIANVLFAFNIYVATIITIIEAVVLLLLLFRKRITGFIVVYVISVCNCLEFSDFVGTEAFFSIKSFRIAGVSIAVWLLIPAVIVVLFSRIKIGLVKMRHKNFSVFSSWLLVMNVIAAIVGLILILFNDNNIRAVGSVFSKFVGTAYTMLFLPFCMLLLFYYILSYEPDRAFVVSYALQAVMWGYVFQSIASMLFGVYGFYGGVNTLLISNVSFIVPMMLILIFDKKHIVYPTATFLIAIIGTILVLVKNANGKHIILLLIVGVIIVISTLKDKSYKTKLIVGSFLLLAICITPFLVSKLMESSVVFSSKINQALGLLNVGRKNWFLNIAASPRMRIAQLINIAYEFSSKPWFIITGKGYMGSIKDHIDMFGPQTTGSYTPAEWAAGTFYNLHEFSSYLLMYGCIGVACSIYLIICTIKKYRKNIWLLVGAYWFLVLYGYSYTLSVFGIIALYYGLINEDNLFSSEE